MSYLFVLLSHDGWSVVLVFVIGSKGAQYIEWTKLSPTAIRFPIHMAIR